MERAKPRVITVDELADYLHVHPSTIYRMLKRRELPAFKIGRDWRFDTDAIDRWRIDRLDPAKTR
jgi:excisionase family DNA binding protein